MPNWFLPNLDVTSHHQPSSVWHRDVIEVLPCFSTMNFAATVFFLAIAAGIGE